jgi:chemotaxis protein MotA
MDPATVIGLLLAFGSVIAMVTMEGGSVASLLLPAPMILVFGATLAVGIAGNTLKDVIQAFKALPRMFQGKT